MIGFYNYTVWLTYISFLSACSGIYAALYLGKPEVAMIFLLFSGLCDGFDGKVASTKKDRTVFEKRYGIQIDSLSDLVAFGVLPAVIGMSLLSDSFLQNECEGILTAVFCLIALFFALAAYIRLAYYNVTEEERQESETGTRKEYIGLPVTSSALVCPILYLFHKLPAEVYTVIYFSVLLLLSLAFLLRIKVKKAGWKGIILMIVIGAIEGILIIALRLSE